MGKRWIWGICALNIALVGYLFFRVLPSHGKSTVRIVSSAANESDLSITEQSSMVLQQLIEEDSIVIDILSQHPAVSAADWDNEIAKTVEWVIPRIEEVSDPFTRLVSREIMGSRFANAPLSWDILLDEWKEIPLDTRYSSAERRSALIVLFRLLLNASQSESSTDRISETTELLKQSVNDPALVATAVEASLVLRREGMSEIADRIVATEHIDQIARDADTPESVILPILRNASTALPDWQWKDFAIWFEHGSIPIRSEAGWHLQRTGGIEALEWLKGIEFPDPDSELTRLRLIEGWEDVPDPEAQGRRTPE